MVNPNLPEAELLETVLQQLLEDFQDWFGWGTESEAKASHSLMETERISFLGTEQQSDLLNRVKQVEQEVSTAQMLFQATGGKVGIDVATLMPWHQLATECRKVAVFARDSLISRKMGYRLSNTKLRHSLK